MHSGIILSQTYEVWDGAALLAGETDDRGFDFENVAYTFRETVEKIRSGGFVYASCSHGAPAWLSTETYVDYRTGDAETKSLHPGRDARSQKYWAKACRAAGVWA